MRTRNKLWVGMQAATLASLTTLSACSSKSEDEASLSGLSAPDSKPMNHAMGEGNGAGEGDGEGNAAANLSVDDVAYLTHLGLMRGHLFVGYSLYEQGHVAHAKTHMKHPESELYEDIVSAFQARSVPGFAAELSGLAKAVEQERPQAEVRRAYQTLTTAISRCEQAVTGKATTTASDYLKHVSELLRVAGEEYAIAVVDGRMENAHEYQDAYGFTVVAGNVVDSIKGGDQRTREAREKAAALIAELKPLWPGLIPPDALSTEASALYGAAARIEILALGLKP